MKVASTDSIRFSGPKITLDASELTEAQERVIREEGLDIEIEGIDRVVPSSDDGDGQISKNA
jgi:hypothetical protein